MSKTVKIIIGVVALGLVVIIFMMLTGGDSEPDNGLITEDFLVTETSASENMAFLQILRDIQRVELDGSIFTRQAFVSLHDFSVPLSDRPRGIVNPFLPIDQSASLLFTTPTDPATIPSASPDNGTSTNSATTTPDTATTSDPLDDGLGADPGVDP